MTSPSRLLIPLVAFMLLAGGCFGPRIVRVPDAPPRTTPSAATASVVAYLRLNAGSAATVTRSGNRQAAQDGSELLAGDEIAVSTGTAVIAYPEAGASQLDAGSDVVLLADGEDGTVFTELQLVAGSVWTRFEKLFGANEQFSVAANGVVATVRGTAFGVSLENGAVDVKVADHAVEVTSETLQALQDRSKTRVSLTAGKALRLTAQEMSDLKEDGMTKRIRTLTPDERKKAGFAFMAKKLDANMMRKPAAPVRLNGESAIPKMFEKRMLFLRNFVKIEAQLRGFVLPTRGVLESEIAPEGGTPTVSGPTTTIDIR